MLFNSIGFVFGFLPLVLLVYHGLAHSPLSALRQPVLILATLVFYAFAGSQFVPLLLASTALNYLAGVVLERQAGHPGRQKLALVGAIGANLVLLGYFKYFNFMLRALNTAFASGFEIELIILPLGISFFTFQQIGYLVDVSRGKIGAGKPLDYASFVLFFPQLLAGPIVQYRETVPQLAKAVPRGEIGRNVLIGLVIFALGLFKKTVIADTAGLYARPVFDAAYDGTVVGMLDTWIAAFAYTAQVYFDFSGYSDMAIGTARMFGVVLPLNFHSPLRARSVVEIWRRWHITLGRWVQNYVFQPISIPLARFAVQRGFDQWGALACGVLLPTMIAMLIVGIWHGAGWTFVIFGLMQGTFMVVNESWAAFRRKDRKARKKAGLDDPAWRAPVAQMATLLAFVVSIIPFGAVALDDMGLMLGAMLGAGPAFVAQADWPLGLTGALATVAVIYLAIYTAPNTQQIMGRFEPVLEWTSQWSRLGAISPKLQWSMTAGGALFGGLVLFLGIAFISRGTTEFIYFNF